MTLRITLSSAPPVVISCIRTCLAQQMPETLPPYRARILIVDDVLVNVKYLLDALKHDYDVSYAVSGEEGIRMARENLPDLVLLDAMMPQMDGYTVCMRLRADAATTAIPIIFITSLSAPEDEARALEMGASDFTTKPVNLAVLRARVRTQVAFKRQGDMLRSLSLTDALTGLSNRRAFDAMLHKEWRRSQRFAKPVSLILADIDHFKPYNDLYGHLAGDECLREIAHTLRAVVGRPQDMVARFGGEEFVILLPEVDLAGACVVAQRVLAALNAAAIDHLGSTTARHVTASLGVSCALPSSANPGQPTDLIGKADGLMYDAKLSGRNRFVAGEVD